MADLDRLLREQNPEPGQPRVPVPQYQKVGSSGFERVTGQSGGAHAVLLGPNGQPISSSNNLAVADQALYSELVNVKTELLLVKSELEALRGAQGRMLGYDGSSWRGVKVDDQGRPILASDLTVNADGLVVNVGEHLDLTDRPDRELGKVQLSGNIMALDPTTGQPKPLSVIQDNDGNFVLRTVKAAEVAYDPNFLNGRDAYRFSQESRIVIETVINNQNINPGAAIAENFISNGADEIWFIIQMNKAPWSVTASAGPWLDITNTMASSLYPMRNDVPTTHVSAPLRSLWCFANPEGPITEYDNLETAYRQRASWDGRVRIVNNHSTDIAQATIRLMKIWRG